MIDTEDMGSQRQATTGTEYGINEALLRSEIAFWSEMIESCDETQTADALERMHQAMALAELRLSRLFDTYQQSGRAGLKRPSNVYRLDDRRKSIHRS
jgi:hypothetical protein